MKHIEDLYAAIYEADKIGEELSSAKSQVTDLMRGLYCEVKMGQYSTPHLVSLESKISSIKANAKNNGFSSHLTGRTNAEERDAEITEWCRHHNAEFLESEMALMTTKARIEMVKSAISNLTLQLEKAQGKVKALRSVVEYKSEELRLATEQEISRR